MPDNRSTFIKRVISGLAGAAVVFSLSYFGGTRGMELVCTLAIVLAIREYSRMAFQRWAMPASAGHAFGLISLGLYVLSFYSVEMNLLQFAIADVVWLSVALWLARGKVGNDNLLPGLTMGLFGLLYCVLLPYFALKLVRLDQGGYWFLFLLILVFFGDTFAYFGGRWFGQRKLMPAVSPGKTWAGAGAGLVGSCVGGTVIVLSTFQDVSWYKPVIFCLVCGAVAQSGDLLMSLVKRVADVKDSGHIMPGHGGILDRLDGLFIACPLVYAFALYVRPV